jgi:hypothetical protein
MKKQFIAVPLALLLLLQAISLFSIGSLKSRITNLNDQISGLQTSQSSLASSIYINVESLMKKQGSIIDSYDFSIGDVDEKLAQTRDFSRELASEVKTRQYLEYQHISSYNYHKTPSIMALALYIC